MSTNRFASVWDAVENTPQEAASMKARSSLMMELSAVIQERGMTQTEAAKLFGVTQPRISDLMRGKLHLFSLDTLIEMAATADMAPVVRLSKPKARPKHQRVPSKPATSHPARPKTKGTIEAAANR